MYALARQYFFSNGNLSVPSNYMTPEGKRFGSWLIMQRRIRTGREKGSLSDEQICLLDKIGMVW